LLKILATVAMLSDTLTTPNYTWMSIAEITQFISLM